MTKRTTRRRTSSRARQPRRRAANPLRISPAQLSWGLGLLLLGVAVVTLLSLLAVNRDALTEWWIETLARGLGWGRYVMPLVFGVLALWLITRLTDAPLRLPWMRLLGGLILLVALLGFTHHLYADREAAVAQGVGGGWLGYYLSLSLETTLGWAGAIVVLAMLLAIGATLLLNLSLEEIARDLVAGWQRLSAWLAERRERRAERRAVAPPEPARPPLFGNEPSPIVSRPGDAARRPAPPPREPEAPSGDEPEEAVTLPESLMPGVHRWVLPPIQDLLAEDDEPPTSLRDIRERARLIEETLGSLGVPVTVVEVNPGPVVTQFGIEPGYVERRDRKGRVHRVKIQVAKIASLANDLALALAAAPIRIEAPVPGKGIVGIEVPNRDMAMVGLRSVMESDEFAQLNGQPLAVCFGRDVSGAPVVDDLASLPHLLIAGATNSGKSVCINALIACLLCRNSPDDLRLLMVDPKRVELSSYNGIPHLIAPVVVDPPRVVGVLKWLAAEMDRRYKVFAEAGARNLQSYNAKTRAQGEPGLPYIVMFIDELADLMMVSPDEVERLVCRIAQLSRATGIHLVIATQRPSVDVVTGLIKANFPARLSFLVSSQVDSRVILDTPGAEKLLGQGDGLYMAPDSPKLARIQGCWVSDGELEAIAEHWRSQAPIRPMVEPREPVDPHKAIQRPLWPGAKAEIPVEEDSDEDPLLQEAIELVRREQRASVSFLQRGLRIGYTRASRLIDTLDERGIIGPATGTSKARDVLLPESDSDSGAQSTAEVPHPADPGESS
jgi:DNA segregation ATPase FtsK/SpoIIIE, S-DNA-T family